MKYKVNPLRYHIQFKTEAELHVTVETERLFIRSVLPSDKPDCLQLFGNPKTMEKYGRGAVLTEDEVTQRINTWVKRWVNHDPYSGYAILEKESKQFMGIIVIGHSSPGESEAAYAIRPEFWGQGYGSAIADAVFQGLVPQLMIHGYKIDHQSLKKMVATARFDNPASLKMLKKVGFKEESEVYKFNAWRHLLGVPTKLKRNQYLHFFHRQDMKLSHDQEQQQLNEGADIKAEDMAQSAFGQPSVARIKK